MKNGWKQTRRTDPNTGRLRPIKILYRNGKEVERHWLDLEPKSKKLKLSYEQVGGLVQSAYDNLENRPEIQNDDEWLSKYSWFAFYDTSAGKVKIGRHSEIPSGTNNIQLRKNYYSPDELTIDVSKRLYKIL